MDDAARAVSFLFGHVAAISGYLEARPDLGKACRFAGKLPLALQPSQVVAARHRDDDQPLVQSAAVYRAMGHPRRAAAELRLPLQARADELEALWPSGGADRYTRVRADRILRLRERDRPIPRASSQ